MPGLRAMLDTCVLVPIVKTDLLLTLARREAFRPLWSDEVVAAAVQGRAAVIVTDNVTDFPDEALEPWGLYALTSDDFLLELLHRNPAAVADSLTEMAGRRKDPPVTVIELVGALEAAGAEHFGRAVRAVIGTG